MNRSYVRPMKKRRQMDRLTLILLVVFVVLAIATAVVSFRFVKGLVASWSMTDLGGVQVDNSEGSNNALPQVPSNFNNASEPMQASSGPTPEPWDGKSRVTILVLGLDYRDWEDNSNAPRSDSMILLTMDPLNKTAGMVSIPRDLWVDIPGGYGYNKINMAHRLGELDKLPGGGPGLAVETVEQVLGVPINYYAQIDFTAFEKFIDEIGGVKLEITEEITLDPVGPAPKVKVEPGIYTLPGNLALAYARNRHLEGDDFTRSEHQQQVIMAIRDRILSFNMLPTLVTKSPVLYKELSSGIHTNLTPEQVIRLAWLAIQIPKENIVNKVIGPPDQVEFGKSPDGQDILLPVPDRIRLVRDEVFASAPAVATVSNEDPKQLVQEENAKVEVQNGTGTPGLAGRTSEYLRNQGINVVQEANAADITDVTTIYIYSGKPYTAKYLGTLLNLPNIRVYNKYDPNASVDLVLVLGSDWASSNNLPN